MGSSSSRRPKEMSRERYIEVYKLRNTAHLKGRHNMMIGPGGSRSSRATTCEAERPAAASAGIVARIPSGVPGLDALFGGGLLKRSVTLVSGAPGSARARSVSSSSSRVRR